MHVRQTCKFLLIELNLFSPHENHIICDTQQSSFSRHFNSELH